MHLGYVVMGTNDLEAAAAFYDALFEGTGITRLGATDRMIYWQGEGFAFAIATPFDQADATIGNGSMIGFDAGSPEAVRRLHQRAVDLGGANEGDPGPRGPRYSSYVRDLDGNKLCLYA